MRSRVALAFLVAAGSCLAFTATASACQAVHLPLDPSAGPGDTVSSSIPGIPPKAPSSFPIPGNQTTGPKTSTNLNGVSGTFIMPDLGSQQQTLTATGTCSCPEDANPQNIDGSMQYLPPPPPAASSGSPQASDSAPTPAVPAHASGQPKTSAKTHAPAASPAHPASAPAAQGSGGGAVLGTEIAAPQPVSTPTESAPQAEAKEQPGQTSSSVPNRVLDTIAG